ncbi:MULTISPECIES: BolA family protein [Burkholderia]|uniref:BolA family transcriptional regulator n=1 Tax=Burkholderia mayonis TaxID=1385591 RepID=A0A1B4FDB2_9BURK|nr:MULTISPECIES: BolA family protein [Burkholderia]AOJ01676.1 BolA family transcriptional regulator [Burkholderia mayonis]KVE40617.1 BolA family transcriptional regulator [Burkholderia sp. BDU5]KVE47465.1 BolA family transcriptional regulator [Burkholderia mayonis]
MGETILHAAPAERIALIETRLSAALAPESLDVRDDSAQHAGHAGAVAGGHYTVTIVSAAFAGKTRVARHRLVYDALADAMQRGIHALAIVAYTPEEYLESSRSQ